MKNKLFVTYLIVQLMLLSGCSYDALMSAQGWREYIGDGGMMTRKTAFEVNRKYSNIGKDWAERSQACLNNRQVTTTSGRAGQDYISMTSSYKTTTVISKQRAELDLQEKFSGGVINVAKEPPDGHYFFVADATPIAHNKTKIEMYYAINRGLFVTAISNWARGKNMGCPDLTKK